MALSPLKKLLLPPVIVSAAVFTAMTLPLALIGSKSVAIKYQEDPVFSGPVREVASPYLGLATLVSLGSGIASAAVIGWRQSARKSVQVEKQLSTLQENLKAKEELLEELKLSESRLQANGLTTFLDDELSLEQLTQEEVPTVVELAHSQPVVAEAEIREFIVTTSGPVVAPVTTYATESVPATPIQSTVRAAASAFPAAQAFVAYGQSNGNSQQTRVKTDVSAQTPAAVEELQNQLKQMISQMEILQTALQMNQQPQASDRKASSIFKVYDTVPPTRELVQVESWPAKKAAS